MWLSRPARRYAKHLVARRKRRIEITRMIKSTEPAPHHWALTGVSCTQIPSSLRRYKGELYELDLAINPELDQFNYIPSVAKTLIKQDEDKREAAYQGLTDLRESLVKAHVFCGDGLSLMTRL